MTYKYKRWVYFAQEIFSQSVKIGSSCYPYERLTQIRVYCPYYVALLGCLPMKDSGDERAMQKRFAKCRMHREWFSVDAVPEIMKLLSKDGWPDAPLCLAGEKDKIITEGRMATLLALGTEKAVTDVSIFANAKLGCGGYDREKSQRILCDCAIIDDEYEAFRKHISMLSKDFRKNKNKAQPSIDT